ncbi:hypothetical protein [Paracoccus sp. SJTW-4]|uniref:hypothetical protein n=1 Tax=Paracoccus sp. SJTW-4 TaxID=3078428 RepID=UPI0039E799ED
MGLIPRILLTWRAPGRAVRGVALMSEPALLALLIGTMALYFVAQWPAHARAAALDPSVPLQARLGGALLATMFLMPLLVLALAWLAQGAARLLGARLDGRQSRLALIWALAAAVPVMLLQGLVQGFVGPGPAVTAVNILAGAAFLLFWISGLRELSGTRRPA